MGTQRNALWPGLLPSLRFHQVGEDIVDARQVAFSLGPEPGENLRVKADARRYFPPDVAQPHQVRQLLLGQAWDISEIDVGVIAGRMTLGRVA